MSEQQRYWLDFVNLKRDSIYFSLYIEKTEKIDWWLNVTKAGISASSITAWLSTKMFPEVWGTIIAAVSVFPAIEPYIPYKARLKGLRSASNEFAALALKAEGDWFDVASGDLDERAISKLRLAMRGKINDSIRKNFHETLPTDPKLVEKADKMTSDYVSNYFSRIEED